MLKKRRIIITMSLVLCMLFSFTALAQAQPSDIQGHWAEPQLSDWVNKGLAQGYPDGAFKPDNSISRAEFMTLTNHALGFNSAAAIQFSDVAESDWFAVEVAKARAAAYISGYEDGSIRPNQAISRQEVAVIMAKIAKLDTTGQQDTLNVFKDANNIPAWSQGAISAVVDKGYMHGYPEKTYQPLRHISRAEAVVTLNNISSATQASETIKAGAVYDKAGVYGPASGTEIISEDVTISVAGITLQNYKISGNLTLAAGIGEGNVSLKNVTVGGKTFIKGGGANSITLENCKLPSMVVSKAGVRVVASGNTSVSMVQLNSGATLVELSISGMGFETVTLTQTILSNSMVTLEGKFSNVNVQTTGVQLNLKSGTVTNLQVADTAKATSINIADNAKVSTMSLNAAVNVTGKGSIDIVKVNVAGSNIEQTPGTIVNPNSLTVNTGTTSGSSTSIQTVTVSGVQLTNTFGAFKFSTDVVTTAANILGKVKVNGVALKLVEKRSQGIDGTAWKAYVDNAQYDTNYTITCESPFTISGTSIVSWPSVVLAPAVSGITVADFGDNGNGCDLQVSFSKADGENQKIASYRVMVVRSASAGSFNLTAANAVPIANYTVVDKTGAANYMLSLDGAKDTAGNSIANGIAYQVFILSIADGTNATVNGLSSASAGITLASSGSGGGGGGGLPAVPTFVSAEVTSSGDISIVFNKDMENTTALAGKQDQFTVLVDGVADVVTGLSLTSTTTKIKISLTTKVVSGQTVSVAYSKDSDTAKQIKAADGGVLESFTAQTVSNGLAPAGPTLMSVEITTQGDLSIYFNKAMADPVNKQAQFTITVDGTTNVVSAVQLTNTTGKVKLSLTTKVLTTGHAMIVAYTKGADNVSQVKSSDGGILESFSQSFTN